MEVYESKLLATTGRSRRVEVMVTMVCGGKKKK
jgi:hypothetical protein